MNGEICMKVFSESWIPNQIWNDKHFLSNLMAIEDFNLIKKDK